MKSPSTCVALNCNHEGHEETRRKKMKSLSAALSFIFSYFLAELGQTFARFFVHLELFDSNRPIDEFLRVHKY
jgi:hypothetical protein